MTRRMRRRLAILGLAVAVPIGALILVLPRLDPDAYKPRLVAAVADATGRTLTLGGPLRIRWSLWPTLSVTDARLANLPGGSRPDMARAERIEAQIALLPLLHHRLEIVRLTLTGPNILFEQVGVTPNWVFTPGVSTRPSQPPAAAPAVDGPVSDPRPAGSASLGVRSVHVVNGMLTFHFPARTRVIGVRSLDFSQPRAGGPLDLASVLVYSDFQPFTLHAHAAPIGRATAPRPTDPWSTVLNLAAFDATASARGTVDLVGGYDLHIAAAIPVLAALNALLPEMHLPALRGLTISTHLSNGPARGDLPVIGATTAHVSGADLGDRLPGLTLGALDLSLPTAGGLATVAAAVRYAGHPFTLAGTVGVPRFPDKPSRVPVALKATANTSPSASADFVSVTGTIGLARLAFAGLDATVALHAASLASFRSMLSPLLPPFTALSLQGRLAVPAGGEAATFRDAILTAAQVEATGDVTVGPGKTHALGARLHASRLDLDALLADPAGTRPAVAVEPPPPTTSPTAPLFPSTPLPWASLRGPAVDLDARIDALTVRHQSWTDLAVSAHLADGRLRLDRLHGMLPGGGALDGSASVDASATPVPVALSVHAPAIPLALLTAAAGLPGPVSGTLALDTRLQAKGSSLHALAASLDGPFSLTLVGGSIGNAAFASIVSTSLDPLGIKVPPTGQMPIHCFGLIGTVTGGLGRFPVIALDTGLLDLSGEGQIDFGQERLALKLHPLARLSGARVAVPVLVEGPFRAVHGRLDASGLDKLGLLIDALFGGDHPRTCRQAGLVPKAVPAP